MTAEPATQTQSLAAFLLARIDEDEAAARGACVLYRAIGEHENVYGDWVPIGPVGGEDREQVERTAGFYRERGARNVEVVVLYDPARVLADVAARRAIVAEHELFYPSASDEVWATNPHGARCGEYPCPTLRHLAAPFADHPDYDESWRP